MYIAQNFKHLLGLEGFSDKALETHFIFYEGYVTNTNKLLEELNNLLKEDKITTPQFAELKRRFGWEFGGMRLHELYFSTLKNGGAVLDSNSTLAQKIAIDFGSFEMWEKDFKATASMRGIGWAILSYDQEADKLINVWVNEHNAGHLTGAISLLVCDVFEHAFIIDYGSKRAGYIDSFMKAIDWQSVANRLI